MVRMNLQAKAMLVVLGLICGSPVHATTQTPEIVLINGGVYYLWPHQNGSTVPLESLWRDPEAKLGKPAYRSDCHRGYVGIWEIHDDCLFLKGLHGWSNWATGERLDMKTIFPGRFKDGRVRADWFSGQPTFATSFGRHISNGRTTLPFAKGKVVPPTTAQHIGMGNGTGVGPLTRAEAPADPVDHGRLLSDKERKIQMPDTFILDGVVYYLPADLSVKAFPLESLWPDPQTTPRLSQRPNGASSFGYARGYRAIWEVHEGNLYMLALEAWTHGQMVRLKALFPDRFQDGRVKAEWFSGDLALISHEVCPKQPRTVTVKRTLDSIKVTLEVQDGNVVDVKHMTQEPDLHTPN